MTAKQHVDVEGRSIALSNLDKVLYPKGGFTKAQVIDYYIRIAPWALPHYAKRPVTMKRFPDGVQGKAFYEKDAPKHTPDWVHTTDVPRATGGKPIRYICIDDLPTLVWCANVASLELHPFVTVDIASQRIVEGTHRLPVAQRLLDRRFEREQHAVYIKPSIRQMRLTGREDKTAFLNFSRNIDARSRQIIAQPGHHRRAVEIKTAMLCLQLLASIRQETKDDTPRSLY
jgi:hypothetical protein